MHYVPGTGMLPRFNGFPAAKLTGSQAAGYSSGQAITAMEKVAKEVLPEGYGFSWSGQAFEEKKSGGTFQFRLYLRLDYGLSYSGCPV
ncbi:MAG: hypothetical protein GY799_10495 [Desulfobulbaceae bacterium]|nr:hypothetical protein [Desulfobulbaceae bacterium]